MLGYEGHAFVACYDQSYVCKQGFFLVGVTFIRVELTFQLGYLFLINFGVYLGLLDNNIIRTVITDT